MQAKLTSAQHVRQFLMAGNATVTIVSKITGTRYTYKVAAPKHNMDGTPTENPTIWFTSLLTGSDNENSYSYFGNMRASANGVRWELGRKSRLPQDAAPVKAFAWFLANVLQGDRIPDTLEVWHEGRCCRCARKLTVPSSIASGVGPECAKHVHFSCAEAA